jgi:hypothetical protein
MMCALIVRRLKEGAYGDFREAWRPKEWWPGMRRVWVARSDDDQDVVATWALLEGDAESIEAMRDDPEWLADETRRMERVSAYEEELLFSGFFTIVEEIEPESGAS